MRTGNGGSQRRRSFTEAGCKGREASFIDRFLPIL
jgi:hypothetical protein